MATARASSTGRRNTSECKPLIETATKDVYRHNAFRITGLPIDATPSEIAKRADKLKLMEELGQGASAHNGVFSLDPPPTVDQIREAIRNLEDPERRLVDEFFWFWPREFGKSASDPALQALANGDLQAAYDIWGSYEDNSTDGVVATHNKALTTQIVALDWEKIRTERPVEENQAQEIEDYWRRSFKRWERLVEDDRLWDKVTARVRQKDDARLKTGFVRRMRASLPEALDKINAELALSYARAGKLELARLHIRFMREMKQPIETIERVAEIVVAPVKARLREQINRAKENVQRVPSEGPKTAKQLLDEAQRCLPLLDLFFGDDHESRNDLFDEVASVCNLLVVAYHKGTQDDTTCLAILRAALPMATSIDLRGLLEKNIGVFGGNIRLKELDGIYSLFKSIQENTDSPRLRFKRFEGEVVPAMMKVVKVSGVSASFGLLAGDSEGYTELFDSAAVVLRGISLDAWNKEQDVTTSSGALDLALQYARDVDLRKRLREDKDTLEQLRQRQAAQVALAERAKQAARRKTQIGWAVAIGIVAFMIFGSLFSNNGGSSVTSSEPSATPSTPSTYSPPTGTYSLPSTTYGNTYHAPSDMSAQLNRESEIIETERASLKSSEAELEALGQEIDRQRLLVDNSDEIQLADLNSKVNRYNTMLGAIRIRERAFNQKVADYNEKLRRNNE